MVSKSERPRSTRRWWLLIAGFIVFVVVFDFLQSLIRPEPATADVSTAEEGVESVAGPAPPTIHRLEDGGIEIRHDIFRRSTIRLGNEADETALFDCLTQGVEQAFADGTEGWSRARVRGETDRVQDQCLGSLHGLPALPPLPPPEN